MLWIWTFGQAENGRRPWISPRDRRSKLSTAEHPGPSGKTQDCPVTPPLVTFRPDSVPSDHLGEVNPCSEEPREPWSPRRSSWEQRSSRSPPPSPSPPRRP